MKKNILLFLSSFFFILLIVELFLRMFLPQETSTPWRIYLNDGLLLNKNKGSAHHYFNKGNIKVKYNFGKYHNRKYNLENLEKKILVLGDSGIFGWLLDDEDTFVYKLAKKFPKYEFINSAAGGQSTSDQVRYLEKFCNKIMPTYTFYIMNFADISRSKNSNLYSLNKNGNLISGNNHIPLIYKIVDSNPIYDFLVSNLHTISFLRKNYVVVIDYINLYKNKKKEPNNFSKKDSVKINEKDSSIIKNDNNYMFEKKLILELQKLSNQCKTQFYLINFAWYDKKSYTNHGGTYEFLNKNPQFFVENKINFIDLDNQMADKYKNPQEYEIKFDGHPNLKASELYYKILYSKLKNIIN